MFRTIPEAKLNTKWTILNQGIRWCVSRSRIRPYTTTFPAICVQTLTCMKQNIDIFSARKKQKQKYNVPINTVFIPLWNGWICSNTKGGKVVNLVHLLAAKLFPSNLKHQKFPQLIACLLARHKIIFTVHRLLLANHEVRYVAELWTRPFEN